MVVLTLKLVITGGTSEPCCRLRFRHLPRAQTEAGQGLQYGGGGHILSGQDQLHQDGILQTDHPHRENH